MAAPPHTEKSSLLTSEAQKCWSRGPSRPLETFGRNYDSLGAIWLSKAGQKRELVIGLYVERTSSCPGHCCGLGWSLFCDCKHCKLPTQQLTGQAVGLFFIFASSSHIAKHTLAASLGVEEKWERRCFGKFFPGAG